MSKKPFFAKFLENQMSENESSAVKGGTGEDTSKTTDTYQTLKYPSDSEDGPGGGTNPLKDAEVTLKYPSDGDEAGDAV